MTFLPGAPLAAVAIRPGGPPSTAASFTLGGPSSVASVSVGAMPEGPGGSTVAGGVPGLSTGTTGSPSDGGLQSTMAQSEQMNLYYLQVQEQVNAQNRTYTALSNVLEVEHSTAKSAISNIH
jgi:hypothetical protein